jgi:hypothetical protein
MGPGFLDVLDRRRVDVFFGVGVPPTSEVRPYTASHLEAAPGWVLVWRGERHAIYLRRGDRENLARAAAWYAGEAVSFDLRRGLDVAEVLRTHPEWAASRGMAPPDFPAALDAAGSDDPLAGRRGLSRLGRIYALVGAYADGVATERAMLALRPNAPGPRLRLRLVYDLLRLDRSEEALGEARRLVEGRPGDPHAELALRVAREVARRRSSRSSPTPTRALLNRLDLGPP